MNEKDKAKRLLEHKAKGFSYKLAYRGMQNRYFVYIIVVFALLYLATTVKDNAVLYILAGMFIGSILRDYSWLRSMKQSWSFTNKITDWEKVQEIAGGEAKK